MDGFLVAWLLEIDYDVELPDPLGQYGALDADDLYASGVEQV